MHFRPRFKTFPGKHRPRPLIDFCMPPNCFGHLSFYFRVFFYFISLLLFPSVTNNLLYLRFKRRFTLFSFVSFRLCTGAHIQNICGGVLFDLGPTFMLVSDKCTDVYPSFLQVPKPTQLKIQM